MNSTVSVVIPTLNEVHTLPGLLNDLQASEYPVNEVVVVDGGSHDATIAIAHRYPFVKVVTEQAGVARQRNAGARKVQGDVILFLDADSRLEPHHIGKMMAEFIERKLHAACPTFSPQTESLAIRSIYSLFNVIFTVSAPVLPSGAGMGLLIDRQVFHHHNGFDETMLYEDIEFIRRVGRTHRYRMLRSSIHVSDRRFKRDGTLNTFLLYLHLSAYFLTGRFAEANKIRYTYGKYLRP